MLYISISLLLTIYYFFFFFFFLMIRRPPRSTPFPTRRSSDLLPLLVRRQFVIERHQDAARRENRVGGEQPLGLIRHDDAGASASGESTILQGFRKRMRALFEIAIGQALFLSLAVGFDQAHFTRKLIQRIAQRFTNGLI